MKRKIYLSISKASASIQSKDRVEALAFAIQIKGLYVSSMLTNTQKSKLKEKFNIGHEKLSRLIENGLKYGYLREFNGFLIANKLYAKCELVITLDFNSELPLYSNKQIKELIQRAIIINQINKVEYLNNTIQKTTDKKLHWKQRKLAMKKLYRYVRTISGEFIGISYDRLAEVAGITRLKAIEFIKVLVDKGVINKKLTFIATGINAISKDKSIQHSYKSGENCGYLRKINSMYFLQLSNTYSVNTELIKRIA